MTQESKNNMRHGGEYMVCVKAQVMTRDDSTGGWVPLGGGGFSTVVLRKILVMSTSSNEHNEYFIHGQRAQDNSVVLNCALRKDVEYTEVNPTFHHWCTEQQRFGLTFQRAADAKAFERGVRRAVDDLLDDPIDHAKTEIGDDEVFMPLHLPWDSKGTAGAGGRGGSCSHSASTISTTTSSPSPQSPVVSPDSFSHRTLIQAPSLHHQPAHLHRLNYTHHMDRMDRPINLHREPIIEPRYVDQKTMDSRFVKHHKPVDQLVCQEGNSDLWNCAGKPPEDPNVAVGSNYSYVQFSMTQSPVGGSSIHEYSYPHLDPVGHQTYTNSTRTHPSRSFPSTAKKHHLETQPALPLKNKKKTGKDRWAPSTGSAGTHKSKDKKAARLLPNQQRCVYCREMFSEEDNGRGSCVDAPDCLSDCVEKVSCTCCARAMLYHCMSDSDGDYGHPCSCDLADMAGTCKKWTALGVLSLFVPCLCCYWPLSLCHRCSVACGCCGGRHKAA